MNYMAKYESQRYRLFDRFDEGIILDDVSWFSVTPQKIAAHIARRFADCNVATVVDAFCGAAGNSIQFALEGMHTVAVELDPGRVYIAKNNAAVYNVEHAIDFIRGDAYKVLPALKRSTVDAVFLSPPWGGPEYLNYEVFDVSTFADIMKVSLDVSPNVAILLPRNVSSEEVFKHFGPCEVEYNYLSSRLKTITAYFGNLIQRPKTEAARVAQSPLNANRNDTA